MILRLVGLAGMHAGQSLVLDRSDVTLGREVSSVIAFAGDSQVSRHHARIEVTGATALIHDLGSSNGTWVNGVRIACPQALSPNDVIQVGANQFRFEVVYDRPPMKREIGSAERSADWTRPSERIYSGTTPDLSGCMMPRIELPDLSGCLRLLLILLIALLVMAVIGGLLMLAGLGVGALAGAGHGPAPQHSGSGGAPGNQAGGAPPEGGEESATGIRIVEVRLSRTGRISVTWENLTGAPVHKLWACVEVFDASGVSLARYPEVVVFDGRAVEDGETRDDSAGDSGYRPQSPPPGGSRASVEPTRWE